MAGRDLSRVIIRPRITEKAIRSTERNVYVFEIASSATKFDVRDAVVAIWKVTPLKVRTVSKKPRTYMSRMRGVRKAPGIKTAYVYLKKGDSISF